MIMIVFDKFADNLRPYFEWEFERVGVDIQFVFRFFNSCILNELKLILLDFIRRWPWLFQLRHKDVVHICNCYTVVDLQANWVVVFEFFAAYYFAMVDFILIDLFFENLIFFFFGKLSRWTEFPLLYRLILNWNFFVTCNQLESGIFVQDIGMILNIIDFMSTNITYLTFTIYNRE